MDKERLSHSHHYRLVLMTLAILCVADGVLTHYGLVTFGGHELSPVLAWLFSIDMTLGSVVRLLTVGVMVWLLWRAYLAGDHRRFRYVATGIIMTLEVICVVVNSLQIAILLLVW